jgi:hypothetical protein
MKREVSEHGCHYCNGHDREFMIYITGTGQGAGLTTHENGTTIQSGIHLTCLMKWLFSNTQGEARQIIVNYLTNEAASNI